jgi:hypothetical protein
MDQLKQIDVVARRPWSWPPCRRHRNNYIRFVVFVSFVMNRVAPPPRDGFHESCAPVRALV